MPILYFIYLNLEHIKLKALMDNFFHAFAWFFLPFPFKNVISLEKNLRRKILFDFGATFITKLLLWILSSQFFSPKKEKGSHQKRCFLQKLKQILKAKKAKITLRCLKKWLPKICHIFIFVRQKISKLQRLPVKYFFCFKS